MYRKHILMLCFRSCIIDKMAFKKVLLRIVVSSVILQEHLVPGINVELIWWESPPYLYGNISAESGKIFKPIRKTSLSGCKCKTVTYGDKFNSYAEFMDYLEAKRFANETAVKNKLRLFLPVSKKSIAKSKGKIGKIFGDFDLVMSPGMTLVQNRFLNSKLYRLGVKGLENAATFVILILLLLVDMGIIIWICERHLHNKNGDFRESFILGVWDAIWWAAVTMTTVGYGDKTPKSLAGRCIGMAWLFMSAALMAGFTALLTSSVGANTELASQRVVVVNQSAESLYVEEKRGKPIVVPSYKEALERAVSLDVVGTLLETNVVAHVQESLFEKGLGIGHSIEEPQKIVILYLHDDVKKVDNASEYVECMKRSLLRHTNPKRPVLKAGRQATVSEVLRGVGVSVNLFAYFYISTGAFVILGVIVEFLRIFMKSKKVHTSKGTEDALEMVVTQGQGKDTEQIKVILDELKNIRATLKDIQMNSGVSKISVFE